jgi:hypothetical protein
MTANRVRRAAFRRSARLPVVKVNGPKRGTARPLVRHKGRGVDTSAQQQRNCWGLHAQITHK